MVIILNSHLVKTIWLFKEVTVMLWYNHHISLKKMLRPQNSLQ